MIDKEKFQKRLKQHRLWLESHGEEGKCADLSGLDPDVADLLAAVAIAYEQLCKGRKFRQAKLGPGIVKLVEEACLDDLKRPK